jgi:hypothetical protein
LAIDVNSVQSCDEVNKDIVDTLRNLLQESCSKLLVRRVLGKVNGDENLLGFGIDITNIDTSLVCKENPIALEREDMVSKGYVEVDHMIGGGIEDSVEKKFRLARANGADSGQLSSTCRRRSEIAC